MSKDAPQDFLDVGNEYSTFVSEGLISDAMGFIDSGSYVLNAALSGSIYGGYPTSTVTAIAGDPATGKTFLCLDAVASFHRAHDNSVCCWFESENATTQSMFRSREGIDTDRIKVYPVVTIEECRHQMSKVLDGYLKVEKTIRPPLMLVLDSLGNLSTNKEVGDILDGTDKRDMTKAQLVKGAFRAITLKLGIANVPLLVTNHTYLPIGTMYPSPEMTGGQGLKYCSSHIMMLGKSKEKDGKDVVGINVRCRMFKSRFTREGKEVRTRIYHDQGMDPFYGLLELGELTGLFKRVSTKWEIPGHKSHFEKAIYSDPEKYFTQEILDELDNRVHKVFLYGNAYDQWLESQGKTPAAEVAEGVEE